ncbi:MAG: SulP family inorganic anion transporter [Lysobacterales bacterium]
MNLNFLPTGLQDILQKDKLSGDFWGGFAAMLVALPSAIAFGVTIYAAIGPSYASLGAIAGILGATALGLFAPTLGGTNRLITAPCAPAAAVMAAFAIEAVQQGIPAGSVVLLLTVLGLLTGIIQFFLGRVRVGSFIKYIPYPVVSGYLSGVGLIIIGSQLPKLLGVPEHISWWQALNSPGLWQWQALVVGLVTVLVMLTAPRFTKLVPAAIVGLLAGVMAYFGIALIDQSLLTTADNPLIIGRLPGEAHGLFDAITGRWLEIGELKVSQVAGLLLPALTLAVLLSIDTLKTCVVLDAMTRSRHDSNRELVAQGVANVASACIGGMPGAGQMGATMVNLSSGGQTRLSGVFEGVLALLAFVLLGWLVAWIPVAGLAGILIIVGVRMIDLKSFGLLSSRLTVFDFMVIAAVVITAVTTSLIIASGIGIALAMLLFIREQLSSTVIRRKTHGDQVFARRRRSKQEMKLLEQQGDNTVIVELQGSLFFGTKDQLYDALEPELKKCTYFILDMRRVQGVDVSVAQVLNQIREIIVDRKGYLIFTDLPKNLPNGRNIEGFFQQMEITADTEHVKVFQRRDEAQVWVEEQILGIESQAVQDESLLDLHEMELLKGRKTETVAALAACLESHSYKAGEKIYSVGDRGDQIFLIRRGTVQMMLPSQGTTGHHLATYGRGDFFGGLSFLDGQRRGNEAISQTDTDLFMLRREAFDQLKVQHRQFAHNLIEAIARVLSMRLRYDDMELAALRD